MIAGVSSHTDKAGEFTVPHQGCSDPALISVFQDEPLPLLSISLGAPPHAPHYSTHLHGQIMMGLNSAQEAMLLVVSLQDPEPHTHSW